jgi:hypothetical protein
LLVSCGLDLPPLALRTESGNVFGEIESWALSGEDGGRVGAGPGHVEVADMLVVMACFGQVAEGDELGRSGCGHLARLTARTTV